MGGRFFGAGKGLAAAGLVAVLTLVPQRLWAAPAELLLRPSGERFATGDPIWWLELHQGGRQLGRWAAATGLKDKQSADRLWSPGNGAPLPAGRYRVGRPEPWGRDLWVDLQPLFQTRRSALGIHHCFPGVGCICLPQRTHMDQLGALLRRHGVSRLQVLQR